MPKINNVKIGTKSADCACLSRIEAMKAKTERVPVMFDRGLVERIDEYSYLNRIRTRAEAIRHLINVGLAGGCVKTEKGTEAAA
ncbi:hypothetical protein M2360_000733 [Rhizobium sp. SG_E_25_P2]|uniref:hypothetical protein n=1 Tax=Rhizobium sp. SG_E_25_P2 TaxID=2879942 RepID=UPI002476CAA3|nr:hypothetical protein [Rhizobium sp. SG_E_25_P2]MDH6265352.1 hypothetical protein [Rhizobium sp. SG_E_25_P2]